MKYNVILMISHDTGRRIENYGHKVNTPNLMELSKIGVQFNEYFCTAPQCSPSRGSILTGMHPHNHGMMGLAHLGFAIGQESTTIPFELKKHGYETTLIGLSHETIGEAPPIADRVFSSTYKLGYDNFIEVKGERSPKVAKEVISFLETRESEKPFYLNVGFYETHRPFEEYREFADNPDEVSVFEFLPDTKKVREDISLYNGSLKVLDKAIGEVTAYLKEKALLENTILIYTTDHGVDFPKAKGALKKAGLETALIIVLPNSDIVNIQRNALLSNVDLMPTILDLVGAEIPDNIDGESFAQLIRDNTDEEIHEYIYSELTWHDRYHPTRSIRSKKYSFVRNFIDGPKIYIPIDSHLSLTGEEVREDCYQPNEKEEFYDLELDPNEVNNLINNEDYKEVIALYRTELNTWLE
ncbi:MAG: sulfatase, partial [Erysipelothrix sp.]|nr:sulfatase [Erysipelothrix sp.]